MSRSKTTLCECGAPKDHRARRCRLCHDQTILPERRCTACGVVKPVAEFRIRTRVTPKPRSVCKPCEAAHQRARFAKKPPKLRKATTRAWERNHPEAHKAQQLRTRLRGLGLFHEHDTITKRMQTVLHCEICGDPPSSRFSQLHVDHCHGKGHFRGLLCNNCNLGLGKFKDDPARLAAAIEYLKTMPG